jgi:hypothetical protein
MAALLDVVTTMEWRLHLLVNVTGVLLDCNQDERASQLAGRVLRENMQIRGLRDLRDWITLLHNVAYVGHRLGHDLDFVSRVFAHSDGEHMHAMLHFRPSAVVCAYAHWLLCSRFASSLEESRLAIISEDKWILDLIHNERRPFSKLLSMILLHVPTNQVEEGMGRIHWERPWQYGLARLLIDAVYVDDPPACTTANLTCERVYEVRDFRHLRNVEYGLTALAASYGDPSVPESDELRQECKRRLRDEHSASARWLLDGLANGPAAAHAHYYIWSILGDTVLRSLFIADQENQTDELS